MRKLLLLLCLPIVAHAEVFKCKTDSGIVYSEKPCVAAALPYKAGRVSISEGDAASMLTVPRDATGRFSVQGEIDGYSTRFLIDTGANVTTIFGNVAHQLGIKSCVPVGVSHTAGGDVAACRIKVSRLSFGGFKFTNVFVVLNPVAQGDVLIGQDLLASVKVHQENGVMTLSR